MDEAKSTKIKCIVCGRINADRHHIKSRGSGGPDCDWNILHLCRQHHTEIHKIGIATFISKYEDAADEIVKKGWYLNNIGKFWNDNIGG